MECLNCKKETENPKFCSRSCSATYNNKKRKQKFFKKCKNCNKELPRGSRNIFCNNECFQENRYNEYIERWKQGLENGLSGEYGISGFIRRYLFIKYNSKCSQCGWSKVNEHTKRIPLEVEHKDGDYRNNDEDNLDLICPNCHSLTATYKGANAGKGRKERSKYSL